MLNIDFESVVSRQLMGKSTRNHSTHALHVGQEPDPTQEADPKLWDETRRKCVFEGKKVAVSRPAGRRQGSMLPIRKCSWFPGRPNTW